MIDRLVITRVPVLIGTGIPLFGPLPHDISLRHVGTRSYQVVWCKVSTRSATEGVAMNQADSRGGNAEFAHTDG